MVHKFTYGELFSPQKKNVPEAKGIEVILTDRETGWTQFIPVYGRRRDEGIDQRIRLCFEALLKSFLHGETALERKTQTNGEGVSMCSGTQDPDG